MSWQRYLDYTWASPCDPPKAWTGSITSYVPQSPSEPKLLSGPDKPDTSSLFSTVFMVDPDCWGFDQQIAKHKRIVGSALELYNTGHEVLMLMGGEDLHPSFYGESAHSFNNNKDSVASREQQWEFNILLRAIELKIPVIGICRGAQMIAVSQGCKLIQHLEGHTNTNHIIQTIYPSWRKEITINSDHHQSIYAPSLPPDAVVLSSLYYTQGSHKYHLSPTKTIEGNGVREVEIVRFPSIKAICFQGHPEWEDDDADFRQYAIRLIQHYL